jgi:hypothetical protein
MTWIGFADRLSRLDKPHFYEPNRTIDIIESRTLNITPSISAYPLPIDFSWFHPLDKPLPGAQWKTGDFILTNVQRNDTGHYYCHARNALGSTVYSLTLNVLCKYERRTAIVGLDMLKSYRCATNNSETRLRDDGTAFAWFTGTIAMLDRWQSI